MLTSLTEFTLIHCTGDKTKEFLQGQLTCDLNMVDLQKISLGAYCNPKGRVLTLLYVIPWEQHYLLLVPKNLASQIAEELTKYARFSKVMIDTSNTDVTILGAFGKPENLAAESFLLPILGKEERYLLIGKQNLFNQREITDNAAAWKLADIKAGIPQIYPQTFEIYTPHQLNLPQIGGVSFNKGCYRGQEIVARMNYLGTLKQKLYLIKITSNQSPYLQEKIFNNSQIIGEIIDFAQADINTWFALALLPAVNLPQEIFYHDTLVSVIS